jgi:hypothetical protein
MLEKKQMRFKANKVVKRWSQREKSVALDEWRANAKLQRHAECSHGKAASKWLHHGVAGALKTWPLPYPKAAMLGGPLSMPSQSRCVKTANCKNP